MGEAWKQRSVDMEKFKVSSTCAKCFAVMFDLVLLLIGLSILSLGIYLKTQGYWNMLLVLFPETYQETSYFWIMVGIGCAVILLALCGMRCAYREMRRWLKIFIGIVLLLILLQVVLTAIVYIFKATLKEKVKTRMANTMKEYRKNSDITNGWDRLQKRLDCCGIEGAQDWGKHLAGISARVRKDANNTGSDENSTTDTSTSISTATSSKSKSLPHLLPNSCCKACTGKNSIIVTNNVKENEISQSGCYEKGVVPILDLQSNVGYALIGFIVVQVVGIIMVIMFYCSIREEYSEV